MSEDRPKVAPPLARQINISSVFGEFWHADVLTVSDLMETTGLTRATVHSVCNDLIHMGWVRPLKAERQGGTLAGRPAKRFTFNERAGFVLGIDLGDTSINVLLSDLRGTTIATRHQSGIATETPAAQRVTLVGALVREVLDEAQLTPDEVLAAGVGLAAPVSVDGRIIGVDPAVTNSYWTSFRIDAAQVQHELWGIHTMIANDANLAALGEQWRGAAQGVDTFVALLAGNRLGAGLMDAGRLLYGFTGGAGEMSFLDQVLDEGGADGLATLSRRWAVKAMEEGRATALLEMSGGDIDAVTARLVFEAAAAGDALAGEVLDRLADRFARLIAMMSIFLNPELVVIGGAVADSAEVLLEPIGQRLAHLMVIPPPRIACSTFGDTVVAVGAVRMALNHVQTNALDQSWMSRALTTYSTKGKHARDRLLHR